nr:class I SAM-dependent methyltransferase [Micromonospora sp. DSM 115978]
MADRSREFGLESRQFGMELLARHGEIREPTTFRLLGMEWDLLPGVFAPVFTGASGLFAEWIPYPVGGSFLDLGCGTGLISVCAARAGCAAVTATDIDARAVENTVLNVRRHGVADRVDTAQGDLFSAVPGGRFDMIFWNSNLIEVDAGPLPTEPLRRAMFDPGYDTHRRFLAAAWRHLRPGGRLLLGFSSLGSADRLGELCQDHGYRSMVLTEQTRNVPHPVRYLLLEFEHPAVDPR